MIVTLGSNNSKVVLVIFEISSFFTHKFEHFSHSRTYPIFHHIQSYLSHHLQPHCATSYNASTCLDVIEPRQKYPTIFGSCLSLFHFFFLLLALALPSSPPSPLPAPGSPHLFEKRTTQPSTRRLWHVPIGSQSLLKVTTFAEHVDLAPDFLALPPFKGYNTLYVVIIYRFPLPQSRP